MHVETADNAMQGKAGQNDDGRSVQKIIVIFTPGRRKQPLGTSFECTKK